MKCHKIKKVFLLIFILAVVPALANCNNKDVNNKDINKNNNTRSTVSQNEKETTNIKEKESVDIIEDEAYINYLKKNTSNLDIEDNNDFSSFKLLDEDIKDNDMFLVGEYHYIKDNIKAEFKFLKYFKEKANFKYLLWETSYLGSKKYNEFLETGNEECLSPFLNTVEELEFWKKLYEYNKTLKNEDKIIVVGPDMGDMEKDVLYLNETLSSKELPEEFKEHLALIKEYKEHTDKLFAADDAETVYMNSYAETREKFMNFYNKVKDNISSYENILKENSFDFEYVLDNIKNLLDMQDQTMKQYSETEDFTAILHARDVIIGKNFDKLYKKLPKGKYFGKYGGPHTYQKEFVSQNNIKSKNFAAEITKEGSPLKDKVISIVCFYDNCFTSNSGMPRAFTSYKSNSTMDSFVTGDNTLIKLNGKNSPYSKELKWDFVEERCGVAEEGVTTDYFQYILVIKNSESDTWLNGE